MASGHQNKSLLMALRCVFEKAAILWILSVTISTLLSLACGQQRQRLEMAMALSPVAVVRSRASYSIVASLPVNRMVGTVSQPPLSSFPFRQTTRSRCLRATSGISSTEELQTTTTSSETVNPPPIPCPVGRSYLPFQKEAILDYLIPSSSLSQGRKGILLGDEMGLGKTISVIGGINVLLRDYYGDEKDESENSKSSKRRFKVLIVAPKSVLSHWEYELNTWIVLPPNARRQNDPNSGDDNANTKNDNDDDNDDDDEDDAKPEIGIVTARGGIPEKDCDIYLINYEIVGKYLEELSSLFGGQATSSDSTTTNGIDVLVCDECHYLKSVDSQRTHATLGHHRHSASQPGLAGMAEKLWLVTGSPVLNNPLELFPLLNALAKTGNNEKEDSASNPTLQAFPEVASLDAFRDRYCGRQETPWGVTYKGGKNLSELRNRLIQPLSSQSGTPLMLRRTKKEVLPELPDKRHQLFPLNDGGIAASEEFELLEEVLKEKQSTENTGLETYLYGLTVKDLKQLSRERGLPVGGRKAELIDRLLKADAKTGDASVDKSEEEDEIKGDEMDASYATPEDPARETAVIGSSALSVLQSAPNENRRKILRNLLRVPKIVNGQQQERGGMALLGALGRARHQTALRKVPYVIELLEIALLSHKVVVFAHHRDVQDAIFRAFSDRAVALNGDTPQEDRMKVVQAFQTDPNIKLFVGSIRASGLGISLTASSHVVFVEMDWSPSIIQQAEDRCHRVGQKASVLVQYIFFQGTIDEHLSQLLVEKQRTLSAAIEEPAEQVSWVFDFGKHSGKSISDVAAEDPGYLKWLVDDKIYMDRQQTKGADAATAGGDGLTEGLIELGFLNAQEKTLPTQSSDPKESSSSSSSSSPPSRYTHEEEEEAGDFVVTFGKHKGKPLKEIPRSYLVWVSLAGASKGKPGLAEALRVYLAKSSSSASSLSPDNY